MDRDILIDVIRRSVSIKVNIVEQDQYERGGVRQLLNYGHTIGHAIEAANEYQIAHGQAVAMGMRLENEIAYRMNLLSLETCEQVTKLIELYGIVDKMQPDVYDHDKLAEYLQLDKKAVDGSVRFVLLEEIAKPYVVNGVYSHIVSDEILREVLEEVECVNR